MNKKIFMIIMMAVGFLYGADIPMSPTTEIIIKKGKFSAITFPFDIVSIDKSPFVSKESDNVEVGTQQEIQTDPVINSEQLVNSEKLPAPGEVSLKAKGPIAMKQDKRMISLFPNKLGTTELTIYGNKEYVMHVSVIVKDKSGADHFNFVGNSGQRFSSVNEFEEGNGEDTKSFEMVEHEEVISKLIKYAYSNSTPDGYIAKNASNSYERAGLKFTLQKKTIGDSYELDTWIVKNVKQGKVNLYPEMFYQDGIYSVSFINPRIEYGEATKMFIVRKP